MIPNVVTPELKQMAVETIWSLSDLTDVKHLYHLTDFGVQFLNAMAVRTGESLMGNMVHFRRPGPMGMHAREISENDSKIQFHLRNKKGLTSMNDSKAIIFLTLGLCLVILGVGLIVLAFRVFYGDVK